MFIRPKNAKGVTYYAIVESYRDPGPLKAPRQRTMVSLGRHPTALAAFTAEEKNLERLEQRRQVLDGSGRQADADALDRAITKSIRKRNKIEPFAMAEVIKRAAAPEMDGMTPIQVAGKIGTTVQVADWAVSVRGWPDLVAAVVNRMMPLKAAAMRGR